MLSLLAVRILKQTGVQPDQDRRGLWHGISHSHIFCASAVKCNHNKRVAVSIEIAVAQDGN
jgi:hypothetical protein